MSNPAPEAPLSDRV